MQSHAAQIQQILAREGDGHLHQVQLVRASLLSVPQRPQAAGLARPQARR